MWKNILQLKMLKLYKYNNKRRERFINLFLDLLTFPRRSSCFLQKSQFTNFVFLTFQVIFIPKLKTVCLWVCELKFDIPSTFTQKHQFQKFQTHLIKVDRDFCWLVLRDYRPSRFFITSRNLWKFLSTFSSKILNWF